MIRQFKLRNEATGAEYSLASPMSSFVYKPTGIGFSRDMKSAHTMSGHYITTKNNIAQPQVGGEFVLTGSDQYGEYQDLCKFIVNAGNNLLLGYSHHEGAWYYLKGRFSKIDKEERTVGGVLRCKFQFKGNGLWRKENPIIAKASYQFTPLEYDKTYDYQYGDNEATGAVSMELNGHADAAVIVEVPGPVTDPVIQLSDDSGVIGVCHYTGTIPSGSSLILSTVPNEAGIWTETGGVKTDALDKVDLTDNNFFGWPVGKVCTLLITATGGLTVDCPVQIFEYYATV